MKFEFNDGQEAEVWIAKDGIRLAVDDTVHTSAIALTPGQARNLAWSLMALAHDREENSEMLVRIDQHLNSEREEKFTEALAHRIRTMSVADSYAVTNRMLLTMLNKRLITAEEVSEIVGADWRVLG